MRTYCVSSPLGPLTLCEEGGRLCALLFGREGGFDATPLLQKAAEQLEEYFSGARKSFDLPLAVEGSAFARDVYRTLCEIDYGSCVTYGELAALSGHFGASRAVGNVLHANPLPVFIPCHRVVGAKGLGNYAWGMEKKRFLMNLEGMDV